MRDILAWREDEADRLNAEGWALCAAGDVEGATDLWAQAHDVARGHADPEPDKEGLPD